MTSPYVDNELINAAKMYDRIERRLDALDTDTGWIQATNLATGWSWDAAVLRARQIGNQIVLLGGVTNSSYNNANFTTVAKLPTGISTPTETWAGPMLSNPGTNALNVVRAWRLLADGSIQVASSSTTTYAYRFDGVFFLI